MGVGRHAWSRCHDGEWGRACRLTRTKSTNSSRLSRESNSWRGVLRELGLKGTSAQASRSVRRHADGLALDYSHFTGGRGWTIDQFRRSVATAHTWAEVLQMLGLSGGSSQTALKGHAARLGIDVSHLTAHCRPTPDQARISQSPRCEISRVPGRCSRHHGSSSAATRSRGRWSHVQIRLGGRPKGARLFACRSRRPGSVERVTGWRRWTAPSGESRLRPRRHRLLLRHRRGPRVLSVPRRCPSAGLHQISLSPYADSG